MTTATPQIAARMALILFALPMYAQALTPAEVFERVKESVFVVRIFDAQGKQTGSGSAVLLPNGKIGTNCHVVEGGARFQVGSGDRFANATLYAGDRDKDICLLVGEIIGGKPAQLGRASSLKVGVAVYAVGAPRGLELSLSDGIVAQLRGGPPPFIQTTAAISPGSSGGGLFDSEGRLVGFTTLYIEGGQNLNFAVPVEWLVDIEPEVKLASSGRSRTDWVKRALALEARKDWQGHLEWARSWAKADPKYADAWYVLGVAYIYVNRPNDAIDAFRQALRIDPEHQHTWNHLGTVYTDLERNGDAIDAFRQALRINPENPDAWNNIGVSYANLKRDAEAIDAFRQALRINPETKNTWNNLGRVYFFLKRYTETVDAFRQALRINPEDWGAWYSLGSGYRFLKRYTEAVDAYRQALRINPEHLDAWFYLAIAYELSGNRTAALKAVRALRRLDPGEGERLFNIIVPR